MPLTTADYVYEGSQISVGFDYRNPQFSGPDLPSDYRNIRNICH